eukprot:58697-Prymnesium_polylepis.1
MADACERGAGLLIGRAGCRREPRDPQQLPSSRLVRNRRIEVRSLASTHLPSVHGAKNLK